MIKVVHCIFWQFNPELRCRCFVTELMSLNPGWCELVLVLQTNKIISGDSDFAQRSYMMTPITNPANSTEEHYNRLHSVAMDNVNRTIAELKARFQCLLSHRPLQFDSEDIVERVVTACCILHNMCNAAKLPVPSLPGYLQRCDARQLKWIERYFLGFRTSNKKETESKMSSLAISPPVHLSATLALFSETGRTSSWNLEFTPNTNVPWSDKNFKSLSQPN